MLYTEKLNEYKNNFYSFLNDYRITHPQSYYFSPATLKFFGERLSDMRILSKTKKVKDSYGQEFECFVLSKSSKNWNNKRIRTYAYFNTENLDQVI